jgi:diguanylate cyclase (GGDEF)-like protein/PAS domain S-box-containing protein
MHYRGLPSRDWRDYFDSPDNNMQWYSVTGHKVGWADRIPAPADLPAPILVGADPAACNAVAHGVARTDPLLQIAADGLLNGGVAMLIARSQSGEPARVVFANDAFVRLTGYQASEVIGRTCDFLRGPDTPSEMSQTADRAMEEGRVCDLEVLHYRRDGSPFWNGLTITPTAPATLDGAHLLLMMRDVTARRRADDRLASLAEKLRDLAMSDPVTGIGNRRSFDTLLDREWRRASRIGGCTTLAMIDIDQFKLFNDNFGHPAGDSCLRSVAHALVRAIRSPTDIVARYGGEEFAVLMPDLDAAAATTIGQRLLDAVRNINVPNPGSVRGCITISCGIITASPPRFRGGPARLLREADRALYTAKREGRDRVHTIAADEVTE